MWTFNAAFSAPLTGITESLQRYLFHWTKCWRNLVGHKHMEQRRNRPCGPLCLRQTLWHVQLLSSVCMWSMSLFHAWSCAYLICFQHPLLAVCSTCVCVCVWKISHTSPLNFPHLTWKLSPRSVTFPSWKTGRTDYPVCLIFLYCSAMSPFDLRHSRVNNVDLFLNGTLLLKRGPDPKSSPFPSVDAAWTAEFLQHFGGFLREIPTSAFSCASMICSIHVHCNSSIWQCELGIWSQKIYFDPNDCY